MSERYDVLVIGGGVGGLTAAAYLGHAGLRTLVLEASETLGGPVRAQALSALDPAVVRDLKLLRLGLAFSARDLVTVGLSQDHAPVLLGRDTHMAARSIAAPADATAFRAYRRELCRLARDLRFAWWNGASLHEAAQRLKTSQRELVERLGVTSAAAWLGSWFESDTLKAALACDAARQGFSPFDAGSALILVWAAAQEMCGLQGAIAVPTGGVASLIQILTKAVQASGAEIQTSARVTNLLLGDGRIAGVKLLSGEQILAPLVLSSLSRHATLLTLAPAGATGLGHAARMQRDCGTVGSAMLVLGLNGSPELPAGPSGRYIVADRLESYAAACTQARLGTLPDELVLEAIAQPMGQAAAPNRSLLAVRMWPVPVSAADIRSALVRKAVAQLSPFVPQIARGAEVWDLQMPQICDPPSLDTLLASSDMRNQTEVPGLLLCGEAAEPVPEISGRGARHAARLAIATHRSGGAT